MALHTVVRAVATTPGTLLLVMAGTLAFGDMVVELIDGTAYPDVDGGGNYLVQGNTIAGGPADGVGGLTPKPLRWHFRNGLIVRFPETIGARILVVYRTDDQAQRWNQFASFDGR